MLVENPIGPAHGRALLVVMGLEFSEDGEFQVSLEPLTPYVELQAKTLVTLTLRRTRKGLPTIKRLLLTIWARRAIGQIDDRRQRRDSTSVRALLGC